MTFLARQASLLGRTVKKALADSITDLASSIAFYAFFGLFPLLLAVIAVTGHLLESAEAQARVYRFVADTFPGSSDLLMSNLSAVVKARGTMSVAAILGLLWSASSGFGAISRAVNRAAGTPPTRSLLWDKLRYLLMALTISTLLVAYVAVTSLVNLDWLDAIWTRLLGPEVDSVTQVVIHAAGPLLVLLMFGLLYLEAPTVRTTWRSVWRGALLASLLTELGRIGFLAYLEHVADLEAVFGSLSSIMVLLLWLYLSSVALILGAEYNAVRAADRSRTPGVSRRP